MRSGDGHTQADKDPLECLVAGGLQVKQGEFVIRAVLGFMADGLKQCRCSVELKINNNNNQILLKLEHISHLKSLIIDDQGWSYCM